MLNKDKVNASITKEEAEQTIQATPEENEEVIKDIQKRNRKNAVKKFVKENRGAIAGFAAMCAAQALFNAAKNRKK